MDRVLVLRTCDSDMRSYGGFQWPMSGRVSAPDWNPYPDCGGGLHGFLWGEGNFYLASPFTAAKWVVCSVDPAAIVDLQSKVKFPECEVIHVGDQESATNYVRNNGGADRKIIGLLFSGGDRCKVVCGQGSSIKGGAHSQLSGDHHCSIVGGPYSHIAGGQGSKLSGGYLANIIGGDHSKITGEDYSELRGGVCSVIQGGYRSVFEGGRRASFISYWWNLSESKKIRSEAVVGENGIRPYVRYTCIGGKWIEA